MLIAVPVSVHVAFESGGPILKAFPRQPHFGSVDDLDLETDTLKLST